MTRAEAARHVGVSTSTIRRWETRGLRKRWASESTLLESRDPEGILDFLREVWPHGSLRHVRAELLEAVVVQALGDVARD